jgi:phasin family protein
MATRKSRNSTRETTARSSKDVRSAQEAAQQGSQQQLAMAAASTSALLRSAELWSQLQLQAVQRSGRNWQQAAERLRTATSPLDLISLQNELMMNSFVQLLEFAQDFVQTATAMQTPEAVPAAAQAAEQATGAAESVVPVMQAWQAMWNPMGLNGAAAASLSRH